MIIENNKSGVVESYGEVSSKKATINQEKMAKLQYMLTHGLYTDAQSAVIVELCNNGMDAIIESGKDPIENPVIVKLFQDKNRNYQLSIEDKGIGMSKDFFENFFMSMLSSTKEDDNTTIGHFGLGSKSWASLEKSVTFTVVKEGKKCKYLCFKGEEFIEYELLIEEDTEEENGVLFEMQLDGYSEYIDFCNKAKKKLSYYDTVALIINNQLHENKIYRTEHFQWCDNTPYKAMHLCLKDVVYTIDFEKLGIPIIDIPIALRFGLDSGITPTPSRENFLMNKETITLIKDKIKIVADYFVKEYNKTKGEYETFLEAYDSINNPYHVVELVDKSFTINSIEQYSTVSLLDVTVKGISLKSPGFYKRQSHNFLHEYNVVAFDDNRGTWKKKHLSWYLKIREQKTVIVGTLAGNVKEYLRYKHKRGVAYITKANFLRLSGGLWNGVSYETMLQLDQFPKDKWRDFIKEWQYVRDSILSTFTDETGVESSKEYQKWLEDKKASQKANRALGIHSSNYKGLNKQKGEITLNKAREHKYDTYAVFDKSTCPIANLHKRGKLTVWFTKEYAEEFKVALADFSRAFKGIDFVWIGEREIKHVKNIKQFITMTEFKESRPFARLATAYLIEDVLTLCPDNEDIIYEAFPKYKKIKKALEEYKEGNVRYSNVKELILEEAKATGNWDYNIHYKVLEFQKILSKFGFLSFLDMDSINEESMKVAKNILYILVKHQNISHNLIEDMELVPKIPAEVYEEQAKEYEIQGEMEVAYEG